MKNVIPLHQNPLFFISKWGGERFPINFQVEPEFGLGGYIGILKAELAVLDRMINEEGVGKEGERYAKIVLRPPDVCMAKKASARNQLPKIKLQWERRYKQKKRRGFFFRVFGNKKTRAMA